MIVDRGCDRGVVQFIEVEVMSELSLSVEFSGCDLGDARLNRRACKVIDGLGQSPNISKPAECKGRADIEACYWLMDNEDVLSSQGCLQLRWSRTGHRGD